MSKKKKSNSKKKYTKPKIQENTQNKNTAKVVLFIFGIGPILGIIFFLASRGFFDTP
tara:strand:+ start:1152 stop:1322 length:171 start_codon:yes stop_codon:yes gene_type:complete